MILQVAKIAVHLKAYDQRAVKRQATMSRLTNSFSKEKRIDLKAFCARQLPGHAIMPGGTPQTIDRVNNFEKQPFAQRPLNLLKRPHVWVSNELALSTSSLRPLEGDLTNRTTGLRPEHAV